VRNKTIVVGATHVTKRQGMQKGLFAFSRRSPKGTSREVLREASPCGASDELCRAAKPLMATIKPEHDLKAGTYTYVKIMTSIKNYWAWLLVIMVIVLAGIALVASWQAHTEPLQASYSTALLAVAGSGDSGNDDDPTNPDQLELFGIVSVSVLLLGGCVLSLAFCEGPAKLSSYSCCLALERPG
jgi:hypothetical protein